MVFKSASRNDSYTVLTEAVDKNNESILIALEINKLENGILVNNITSAYGREENEWFIEQIKLGNLVYQDKKRSLEWTNPRRLSLPNQMTTQGSLNVIQKEDIVNKKTPNFSFSERHLAFTENQQDFLRELGFTNSVDENNTVFDWKMSKTIPETNKKIYFETGPDRGSVNCFACYEIDESKDNIVRTDLLRRYAEEKNASEEAGALYMRVSNLQKHLNDIVKQKSDHVNENDVFFYIKNEQTYGFAHNGKVYLNPDIMNSEVAVHEYTHLWDNYTQKTNPQLWEKGKEIFKNT